MKIINIFRKILSYIYPNRCICCQNIISYDKNFCSKCICHVRQCSKVRNICIENFSPVMCVSVTKYDNIKSAIWHFKFRNMKNYYVPFAQEMYLTILNHFKNISFDYVTCVPLHKNRLKSRGYNQSELLAKYLSEKLSVEFVPILKKNINNLPQHTLSFDEREKNIRGVYSVNQSINVDKNKNILLCDDIITTGSTLKECAKTLKKSGFNNIYCVTLAYA